MAFLAVLFRLHENPQRLLGTELDALADDVRELCNCGMRGGGAWTRHSRSGHEWTRNL